MAGTLDQCVDLVGRLAGAVARGSRRVRSASSSRRAFMSVIVDPVAPTQRDLLASRPIGPAPVTSTRSPR